MAGKNHRSAKSGKFVTADYAKKNPATTLSEERSGGATGRNRSAKSGKFVSQKVAAKNPKSTVKEK